MPIDRSTWLRELEPFLLEVVEGASLAGGSGASSSQGTSDHGALTGLGDQEDHMWALTIDGSRILTADWDIGNGRKILADEIRARDADGLRLYDQAGAGIFVEDGGFVGIGTTTPQQEFHIELSTASLGVLIENTGVSASDHAFLEIKTAAGTSDQYILFNQASGNVWSIGQDVSDSDKFKISDNNAPGVNDRLVIDTSGNVGIGTTTPAYNLHVADTAPTIACIGTTGIARVRVESANNPHFLVTDTTNSVIAKLQSLDAFGLVGTDSNHDFAIYTNNVEKIRIQAAGNVGIGTNAPTQLLDVNGDTRLRGHLYDSDNSAGVDGYVLSRDAGGVVWLAQSSIDAGTLDGLDSTDFWLLAGNAGTNPTTDFIGTTDAQDLVFRTNNTERARIESAGNIVVSADSPIVFTNPTATTGLGLFIQNTTFSVSVDATTTLSLIDIDAKNTNVAGSNQLYNIRLTTETETVDTGAALSIGNNGTSDGIYIANRGKSAAASTPTGIGMDFNRNGSNESRADTQGIGIFILDWSETNQGVDGPHMISVKKQNNPDTDHPLIELEGNRHLIRMITPRGGGYTPNEPVISLSEAVGATTLWVMEADGDFAYHADGAGTQWVHTAGDRSYIISFGTEMLIRTPTGGIRWQNNINTLDLLQLTDAGSIEVPQGTINVGTIDTIAGIVTLRGNGTGSAEGGEIVFETAADHDTTINAISIDAYEDDLRIHASGSIHLLVQGDTGNVGIGTTTPGSILDIDGGSVRITDSVDTALVLSGKRGSYPAAPAGSSHILTSNTGGSYPFDAVGNLVLSSRDDNAVDIVFATGVARTNRMVIRGSGQVGIGVEVPDTILHVRDGDLKVDSGVGSPRVVLHNTVASSASGGRESEIVFRGEAVTAGTIDMVKIEGEHDGATDDVKSRLIFRVENGVDLEEVLRLSSTEVVVNDASSEFNFRVETTGNDNTLYVHAGDDRVGIGTNAPDRLLHVEGSDGAAGTVLNPLRLTRTTTDPTPLAGIGVGLEFETETSAGNNEIGIVLEAVTTVVTATSEDFDLIVKGMRAGGAADERLRIVANGIQVTNGAVGSGNTARMTHSSADVAIFWHDDGGGLFASFEADAVNDELNLYTNGVKRSIQENGSFTPGAHDTYDLGNLVRSWRDLYVSSHALLNTTSVTNMAIGAKIDQGTNDDEILTLQSDPDVNHGMTTRTEAASYATWSKVGDLDGGAFYQGFTDQNIAHLIRGHATTLDNTKTSAAIGVVMIDGYKKTGSTSTAPSADENILVVRAGTVGLFIVDREGDLFADGGTSSTNMVTQFDEHDDAGLVRALDLARHEAGAMGLVRSEWDDFVNYNEADLVGLGVLGDRLENGGLINVTRLQQLHNGAIWQQHIKLMQVEAENQELRRRIERLEAA